MFTLVLLALADTTVGVVAMRLAASLAARHGAGFAVQHVSGPLSQEGGCVLRLPGEADLAARRAEVEALCRVAMPVGLTSDVMLAAGFVHVEVLKTARLLGPDLLVLGGLDEVERCRRELTGSATKAALVIAAAAPCPVLVVPSNAPMPSVPFQRVLAATDLSFSAEAVLGVAARLAACERASLRAFHALPQPSNQPGHGLERELDRSRDRLAFLARSLPLVSHMDVAAREGDPSVEILKDARESQADLIVLAADRYGQDSLIPGRVLDGARCAVLLVGPQAPAFLAAQPESAVAAEARG
ncbi:MAG: universal stress protein [Humidesulfovibrio sp.]|uniref:universal stress protein n=1 Tax=Humidesulfovibrio sp. TaxID=2910988 RepID=UPI0027FA7BF8|nr:universal stress protein [Humidesulfovibrio sp.]MDQ7834982.1 universal stress protein [Humidesulfovibrio sp.]